jgi:hypothetical protein
MMPIWPGGPRPLVFAALLLPFLLLVPSRQAQAQCGAKRSTCSACHDGTRAATPLAGPWHDDHAFADVCTACHGGDGAATEPAVAHRAMVAPLGDVVGCRSCHGEKAVVGMVARYVEARRGVEALGDAGVGRAGTGTGTGARDGARDGARESAQGERGRNWMVVALIAAVAGVAGAVMRRGHAEVEA